VNGNSTVVFNANNFSGKGTTVYCGVNTTYDYIIGSGHMTSSGNTVMRCSVYNSYANTQNVDISAIRFYI
jgi:hypothetical protein